MNMTPKEKAADLIIQFKLYASNQNRFGLINGAALISNSKKCVVVCVKEIIRQIEEWDFMNDNSEIHFSYWKQVLEEIEK